MKKQIEQLRAAMEAAQADEMREAKENDSMVFVPHAEIIKSYFEGYSQALKDIEDDDAACGSDSTRDITYIYHRLDALVDQARAEVISCEGREEDDEMSPEQAYAEGCLSAYKRARYQVEKILDLIDEFEIQRKIEGLVYES